MAAGECERWWGGFVPGCDSTAAPRVVQGRMLSEIINERHENVRYFPDIALPENLVAVPDLEAAVADADILVFCVPHQFMRGIVKQIQGKVRPPLVQSPVFLSRNRAVSARMKHESPCSHETPGIAVAHQPLDARGRVAIHVVAVDGPVRSMCAARVDDDVCRPSQHSCRRLACAQPHTSGHAPALARRCCECKSR